MPNKQTLSFEDMGIEHASVREARENFAPLLTSVATASERVVLTRHGKPWVAIVDIDDLNELIKLDDEKLSAFALEQHKSVNDVTRDHYSTQETVKNVFETKNIHSDTAPERTQALENKVLELKRKIEELNIEKARLEGMVEVFQSTRRNLRHGLMARSIEISLICESNEVMFHVADHPKNKRRKRVNFSGTSAPIRKAGFRSKPS